MAQFRSDRTHDLRTAQTFIAQQQFDGARARGIQIDEPESMRAVAERGDERRYLGFTVGQVRGIDPVYGKRIAHEPERRIHDRHARDHVALRLETGFVDAPFVRADLGFEKLEMRELIQVWRIVRGVTQLVEIPQEFARHLDEQRCRAGVTGNIVAHH